MNATADVSRRSILPSPFGRGVGGEGVKDENSSEFPSISANRPHPNPLRAPAEGWSGEGTSDSAQADSIVQTRDLCLYYGAKEALFGISMDFPRHQVTALIGPSGCGKSTFLRCLNRMNDLIDDVSVTGSILLDGEEVNDPALDVIELRRRVGMVFQKAVPFPKSI